jgi:hypothetical protein
MRGFQEKRPGIIQWIRSVIMVLFLITPLLANSQEDVFRQSISLPRQNSSVYSVLNQISSQSGYYFVYNTDLLDSDRRIRLRGGEKPIGEWLAEIIDDRSLDFQIIENHILVYRHSSLERTGEPVSGHENSSGLITIQGRVLDEGSRDPLPFATIGIKDEPIGITTNSDGVFTLQLPGENFSSYVTISHLGYRQQVVPVMLFAESKLDILLETDYISIQEVMIRYYDPLLIVNSAMERLNENYSEKPVYLMNFYREGVLKGNRFINYSEAIFQVYKSPYGLKHDTDQVRLLKSRSISNVDRSDTLVVKIKAGVRSSLGLDFVKNIPDFLDPEYIGEYEFMNADIISYNGNMAYAVSFEQRQHITQPLYKGILYIEMETLAFLGADFEVHPKYINKARNQFLTRKNRNYRASVDKAAYSVSYKFFNGRYHLNHVRADLHLNYRKRYQLFSNNYHVFVEMATSKIETENVDRFDRKEILLTDRVFQDGNHVYDPEFWRGYSIIAPEERITSSLMLIESKIESVIAGQNEE